MYIYKRQNNFQELLLVKFFLFIGNPFLLNDIYI